MRVSRVTVVDVDMPFLSMVGFMIKWALATIPALLILLAIAFVAAAGVGVLGVMATAGSRMRMSEYSPVVTPTLEGLRSVVIGKGFSCIETSSNRLTRISDSQWRLHCPGESYEIWLSHEGDAIDVRRTRP